MFHEIRVPFNSISLGLHLLEVFPDHQTSLEQMKRASSSMESILNNTLDLSAVAQGKFKLTYGPTNIGQVVLDSIANSKPFANSPANSVQLSAHVDAELKDQWFWGDKTHLSQIFSNFIGNGIKFCPHDGAGMVEVEVGFSSKANLDGIIWKKEANLGASSSPIERVSHVEEGTLTLEKTELLVRVSDNGAGISQVDMFSLFNSYQQLDSPSSQSSVKGTGLGLAICLELATLLGGRVGVRSGRDTGEIGAEFFLAIGLRPTNSEEIFTPTLFGRKIIPALGGRVPTAAAAAAAAAASSAEKSTGRPPKAFRILLVDDNNINRKLLDRTLKAKLTSHMAEIGCTSLEIVHAVDGKDAVEKALGAVPDSFDVTTMKFSSEGRLFLDQEAFRPVFDLILMDCNMPVSVSFFVF